MPQAREIRDIREVRETTLRGLYAITPLLAVDAGTPAEEKWLEAIDAALLGGAKLLQFRDKSTDAQRRLRLGLALRARCRERGAYFVVNDDLALALQLAADGLHIGGQDGELPAIRQALPAGKLLGVSCYADLERAHQAIAAGANYVAFGAVATSKSKPAAKPMPAHFLTEARQALQAPICAIGGITLARAPALIDSGADLLAVIDDLFAAKDIQAQASAYQFFFEET